MCLILCYFLYHVSLLNSICGSSWSTTFKAVIYNNPINIKNTFLFTGNHKCVAVINNFVPKSEVDYYTVPQGLETEPKLPPRFATPLHRFVIQVIKPHFE